MWWLLILIIFLAILFFTIFIPKSNKENKLNDKKTNNKYKENIVIYKANKDSEFEIDQVVFPYSTLFNQYNKGINKIKPFFISPDVNKELFGHTYILGGSGTGKTTRIVEPLIYFNALIKDMSKKPSFIIADPKPNTDSELFKKYGNFLKNNGYKVKVINFKLNNENLDFRKNTFIESNFYNPFIFILQSKNNKPKLKKEVEKLTYQIIPESLSNEKHWENSARNLLKGLIFYMIESNQYNDDQFTFNNLSILINTSIEKIANEIKDNDKFMTSNEYLSNIFRSVWAGKTSQNELNSIISTLSNYTSFLNDDLIKIITSKNDFIFDDIEKEPTAIFLKTDFYSEDENKLITIFISQLTNFWIEKRRERHLLFILDEFNNLTKIHNFSLLLDKTREYKLWFFIVAQSIKKTEDIYGSFELFKPNFYNLIILGTSEDNDIKKIIGENKIDQQKKTISSSSNGSNSISISTQLLDKLSIDEVKNLDSGEIILSSRKGILKKNYIQPFYMSKQHKEIIDNIELISINNKYIYNPVMNLEIKIEEKPVIENNIKFNANLEKQAKIKQVNEFIKSFNKGKKKEDWLIYNEDKELILKDLSSKWENIDELISIKNEEWFKNLNQKENGFDISIQIINKIKEIFK